MSRLPAPRGARAPHGEVTHRRMAEGSGVTDRRGAGNHATSGRPGVGDRRVRPVAAPSGTIARWPVPVLRRTRALLITWQVSAAGRSEDPRRSTWPESEHHCGIARGGTRDDPGGPGAAAVDVRSGGRAVRPVRPRYPPTLFDDLAELTGIGPGSRVLETGPGTGQATGSTRSARRRARGPAGGTTAGPKQGSVVVADPLAAARAT
jgi:hypothetical protein